MSKSGNISSDARRYWLANSMQALEHLVYWAALLQLPVYIAQKGAGGLAWSHGAKGAIFFAWALVQNLTAAASGGFADRFGSRKTLFAAHIFIVAGYFALATQSEFIPFLSGTLVLGFGLGLFKPALQGAIAGSLRVGSESVGWGAYVAIINFAVFFSPPLGVFLKAISWSAVFWGCGAIASLNFIILIFFRDAPVPAEKSAAPLEILAKTARGFAKPKIALFALIMTGFTTIYMQFYMTTPNFIFDWVDTSAIVSALHLPDFMTLELRGAKMISYEWLYNINTGLIAFGVVFMARASANVDRFAALTAGLAVVSAGFALCGASMSGWILIGGFAAYTLGEMVVNPKFSETMASFADAGEKSLFMSYSNVSWGLGLGLGALSGGWLYDRFGEKAALAARYLRENFEISAQKGDAFARLCETLDASEAEATALLWNAYSPQTAQIPFVTLGAVAVAALVWYGRKFGK